MWLVENPHCSPVPAAQSKPPPGFPMLAKRSDRLSSQKPSEQSHYPFPCLRSNRSFLSRPESCPVRSKLCDCHSCCHIEASRRPPQKRHRRSYLCSRFQRPRPHYHRISRHQMFQAFPPETSCLPPSNCSCLRPAHSK